MTPDAIVYINSDPSTLGDEATESDIDGYAANLATHLSERFDRKVAVYTRQTLKLAECEDGEIRSYVRELHSGDGWTQFVP